MRIRAMFGLVAMARSLVRQSGATVMIWRPAVAKRSGFPATVAVPIDLAEEIRRVVGNHINDMKLERFRGWNAYGGAHCLGCPVRIATVEVGEAADIGHCIVYGFSRLCIGWLLHGSGRLFRFSAR